MADYRGKRFQIRTGRRETRARKMFRYVWHSKPLVMGSDGLWRVTSAPGETFDRRKLAANERAAVEGPRSLRRDVKSVA